MYTVVLWLKTQILTANLLTANCKISRRNCVKNKSQRGISPRNSGFRGEIRGGTRRKSISVIMHKNQLTGVSRCFAAKKMAVTFFFFFFLFKFNFNLDVLYHFKSYQCFVFVSIDNFV